jgi:hypothetical protein
MRVRLPKCGATFLYYYTFPYFLIAEFAGGADMNNKYSVGGPVGMVQMAGRHHGPRELLAARIART